MQCYPFKSRLQEYAQKVGIPTPEYDTVMEGPSHEPVFRSTVTVNGARYLSLPGFYNRKTAEQSAAEVALYEIYKSGQMDDKTPTVHETGLCKNLLQEYSQKMNYAMPSYTCDKQVSSGTPYCCTVVVGGIRYIGAAAKTKKEAEINAARTALLAIRTSSCDNRKHGGSEFTVVPGKRKVNDTEGNPEAAKFLKPKKAKFEKKMANRKFAQDKGRRSRFKKYASREGTSAMQDGPMVGVVDRYEPRETSDFEQRYVPKVNDKLSVPGAWMANGDAQGIYGRQLRDDSLVGAVSGQVLGVNSRMEVSGSIEDFGGPYQSNSHGW